MLGNGVSEFDHKVAKRYFSELNIIRQEAGESGNSSEDENYPGMDEYCTALLLCALLHNFVLFIIFCMIYS